MSGLSRLALLWLLLPAALAAQGLPDVGRLEVEDARLVLLDGDGKRLGVLEGKKARKGADGVVVVSTAVLTVTRGSQQFRLACPDFRYNPGAGVFDVPAGATVELPDGGRVEAPPGKGEITYGNEVNLRLTCKGSATLRSGSEAEPLVQAAVVDPVVQAHLVPPVQGEGLTLKLLSVAGTRGGELGVRLSSVPSAEPGEAGPGVVRMNCFGDVRLELTENGDRASLLL
ncbi:MAG: hypothetical protein IT463_05200, partial [Planctomycetes bacterium]|nr:hypothetical protein [Planctomycetota bacterium]